MPLTSPTDQTTGVSLSLRLTILSVFLIMLLVTVVAIMANNHQKNVTQARILMNQLVDQVMQTTVMTTDAFMAPADRLARISGSLWREELLSPDNRDRVERYAIEVLKTHPQLAMVNVGDEHGNFLMPKRMPDGTIATKIVERAPASPFTMWKYRDLQGRVARVVRTEGADYDPRTRPWYRGAKDARGLFRTAVYLFYTDGQPGITISYPVFGRAGDLAGVVGLDVELVGLSDFLRNLWGERAGTVFLLDREGRIVAHPHLTRDTAPTQPLTRARTSLLKPEEELAYEAAHRDPSGESGVSTPQGTYFAEIRPLTSEQKSAWQVVVIAREEDFLASVRETNRLAAIISLGVALLALAAATRLSRSIADPIRALTRDADRISQLDLEDRPLPRSFIWEVRQMADAMAHMRTGLRAFRRYVPERLVRQLIQMGQDARVGGELREVTIMFTDVEGFSPLAESMDSQELLGQLSQYLAELTEIIHAHGGTVDKYLGDGMMILWGAPLPQADQADRACQTALCCKQRVAELNAAWEAEGRPVFRTRFGIHTGRAVVGNIGSESRMDYTAVGDSVNVAARLQEVNKEHGTTILISQATRERCQKQFDLRLMGEVEVRGRRQTLAVFELQ
jgi:adenylate cyclase